mgnify:CR=1 FL=1
MFTHLAVAQGPFADAASREGDRAFEAYLAAAACLARSGRGAHFARRTSAVNATAKIYFTPGVAAIRRDVHARLVLVRVRVASKQVEAKLRPEFFVFP